jgi:hypothetical protein
MVRAGGFEPPRAKARRIFLPATVFTAVQVEGPYVCGLDYPFTLTQLCQVLGAARLVSTPSEVREHPGLARDRHLTGFPEFEQFCTSGFPEGTQFGLSPLRLPIPPRPQCQACPKGAKRFASRTNMKKLIRPRSSGCEFLCQA